MTPRDIFQIFSKAVGLCLLCYGVIIGIGGAVLLYSMDQMAAGASPSGASEQWVEVPWGEFYLIILYLGIQGILPVILGLLLMGTDVVPNFCFPKRFDKRLPPHDRASKPFEISDDAGKWKPPRF